VHNADAVQFAKRLQNLLQNAPHNQGVSLGLLVATRRSYRSQADQNTSKVRKSKDRSIRVCRQHEPVYTHILTVAQDRANAP
jgi:hypothetical protein